MGKGGGKSAARGGGGGAAKAGGKDTNKVTQEKEFSAADLKAGKDRIGEPKPFNSEVKNYADDVANSVKPGDKIIVEKSFKNGTTQSTTLTVKESTQTMYDGSTRTNLGVQGNGFNSYLGDTFLGTSNKPDGWRLAELISTKRSSVKSVRVRVKKR